jgi:hypothetical protein
MTTKRKYTIKSRKGKKWGTRFVYPWNTWLNGESWTLEQGVDFQQTAKSFRDQVYIAAGRRGITCNVHRESEKVFTVQAMI